MFSLGMAGVSALLLTNLGSAAQSRNASIASIAAANLAEQILFNPVAIDRYLNPPESVTTLCQADDSSIQSISTISPSAFVCSPQQQADYDFSLWQIELSDQLRHSASVVCFDSTPQDGDGNDNACDGAGSLVIKIFWVSPAVDGNQSTNKHRYTLVAG
jgi:Tfp pilus assembly protein PilV